jgi:signal transduction histidine kinase
VRLEQEAGGGVRVVVEDDGVGFEPSTVPDDRFGLEGIRQRAQLLGGEAMITSLPGRGTTVTVRLPLDR